MRAIKGHKGDVKKLVLLNNETILLSASTDSTVKLWELVCRNVATNTNLLQSNQRINSDPSNLVTDLLANDSSLIEETVEKDRQILR